jgi:hypothetical protein
MIEARAILEAGTLLDEVLAQAEAILAAHEGKPPKPPKPPSETLYHLTALINGRGALAREAWAKAFGAA